jgi:hypothetical protein
MQKDRKYRCTLTVAVASWLVGWVVDLHDGYRGGERDRRHTMPPHSQRHKTCRRIKNIDAHSQWQWLVGWPVCVCDGRGRRCGHHYRVVGFYLWSRKTSVRVDAECLDGFFSAHSSRSLSQTIHVIFDRVHSARVLAPRCPLSACACIPRTFLH